MEALFKGVPATTEPFSKALEVGVPTAFLPPTDIVTGTEEVEVLPVIPVKTGVPLKVIAKVIGEGEELPLGEILSTRKLSPYEATHEV